MSPSSKTEIDAAAAEKPSLSISEVVVEKTRESVDVDIDFLGASTLPPPPVLSSKEEKRLYRKIDRRLMPIVALMYLGGFLDRGGLIPAAVKSADWAKIGVNVDADFEPLYVIPQDKKKVVKALKDALADADELVLATDEDREGESISWHLLQVL